MRPGVAPAPPTAGCADSTTSVAAHYWVLLSRLLWGVSNTDQTRQASIMLRRSIEEVEQEEGRFQREIRDIAQKIRPLDRVRFKPTIVQLLRKSQGLRQQLALTTRKRETLEQHLATLSASQLNQSVVHSVKQTSTALKSMGLETLQDDTDAMMVDLQESMQDVRSIGSALATPFDAEEDLDFDGELDMLLNYDTDLTVVTAAPAAAVSMAGAEEAGKTREAAGETREAAGETREAARMEAVETAATTRSATEEKAAVETEAVAEKEAVH